MSKKIWSPALRDLLKKKKEAHVDDKYNEYKDSCGIRDPTPGDFFAGKYGTKVV